MLSWKFFNFPRRLLNFHNSKSKQYFIRNGSLSFTTLTSPEIDENKSLESNKNNADNFGTLRKSIESKFKTRRVPSADQNVKVVKIKKRPDFDRYHETNVFGNLSDKKPIWYPDLEEESIVDNDISDDSVIVRNISRKFRNPEVYLENMKQLVSEKKLKEALDLFLDMRKNFVAPEKGHYTFMIGACGRAGYTDMAFKLLRQMTDRNLKPTPATLTGVFNSCSESPFPEYSLKKAQMLREKIKVKNWTMNQITYRAMIKAFGKCGDIQTAFQIVDEMAKEDIKIDVSTYSFLLMSCISNKEAGFTHAVEVWRKMKERSVKPDVYSFNLLLRATRDCDVGPNEISCLLLQHWSSFPKRPYGFETKEALAKTEEILQIESAGTVDILPDTEKLSDDREDVSFIADASMSKSLKKGEDLNSAVDSIAVRSQNLLSTRPMNGSEVLELGDIRTPSDRLTLLGNAKGFLLDMKRNKVCPDIKTFTLLLECIPPTIEAEEELISLLDVYNVKPDVGFFNSLIKRRSFRFKHVEASKVLLYINKWSLTPDIITYGSLALGCTNFQKAKVFISDMRKLGLCPNTIIVGSLLSGACTALDFDYMENVLELMEEEGIKPNDRMLQRLETTVKTIRKNIYDMEHGRTVPSIYEKEGFAERYKEFCQTYEQWLKNIKYDKEEHVWEQYKTKIF
ncbi:hypothetical protein JTE90_003877 [Oedothorax gibbosus]|uniref:Pentatricopeptide repeat-containing protein 1, mitochondrial n=1 Tax=Oedothorax gibbosus TaxID=931172 RepID=A0AAV6UH41_9ARAC|nr:hypothetical protein JTE90_003877 [Oedothorax gibbosus]